MTLSLAIPRLETPRLILRGPKPEDFEPLCAFLLDRERAWGFGVEKDRAKAWRWFALSIGHWALQGYGYFTIEWKETGAPCGMTGIWNPEGWPEPELGWLVYEGFEARGIAFEGATRARDWAYDELGLTTLTSNIVPGNTRSIALAERLGAWFERSYDNVEMGEDLLYRHPSAAELGRCAPTSEAHQ
ncbi:MAG: GNAT family N-acetyltransferase [Pseudomonadota bacterium]